MKVVTICGSMRFDKKMKTVARNLETKAGYCVLQPVYGKLKKESIESIEKIVACHYKKIDMSDAVYVLNIDGYIGAATKAEIKYAKSKGKEIIYHEPLAKPKKKK